MYFHRCKWKKNHYSLRQTRLNAGRSRLKITLVYIQYTCVVANYKRTLLTRTCSTRIYIYQSVFSDKYGLDYSQHYPPRSIRVNPVSNVLHIFTRFSVRFSRRALVHLSMLCDTDATFFFLGGIRNRFRRTSARRRRRFDFTRCTTRHAALSRKTKRQLPIIIIAIITGTTGGVRRVAFACIRFSFRFFLRDDIKTRFSPRLNYT